MHAPSQPIADSLSQYIMRFEKVLTNEQCDQLIEYFEKSPNKYWGPIMTMRGPEVHREIKNAHQCNIELGSPEDKIIESVCGEMLREYGKTWAYYPKYALTDSGYMIKKYDPDEGFYDWHVDQNSPTLSSRVLVFIWYLNTVEEGGETEFMWGDKIHPIKGDAVIFPAMWLYPHRANLPKNTSKYIVTTWISYAPPTN